MNITIKHPNLEMQQSITVDFPCEEQRLYEICNQLGIEMTTKPNCYIVDIVKIFSYSKKYDL